MELEEIPDKIRRQLNFKPVRYMDEVLELVLQKPEKKQVTRKKGKKKNVKKSKGK